MSLPKTPSTSTPEGKNVKISASKEETGKVLQGINNHGHSQKSQYVHYFP